MGQPLGVQRLQDAVAVAPGEVAGRLATAVEHQDRTVAVSLMHRSGERGGGGVGDVVGDEPDHRRVQPGQDSGQERGRSFGVLVAQPVPRVVEAQGVGGSPERGIERVRHGVQAVRVEPRRFQAPGRGPLGQLPRRERHGPLAVLAPAEPFLLRGRHHAPVDHQGGRRIVEYRIDPEHAHAGVVPRARPANRRAARVRSPGGGYSRMGLAHPSARPRGAHVMTMPADEQLICTLKRVARGLQDAGIPFVLAGSFAVYARGGGSRDHDVDFQVYEKDCLVDLIFRPVQRPVTDETLADADLLSVNGCHMPVLSATELMIHKILSYGPHYCDFTRALPVARSIREQIDWARVRRETAHSPYAQAFLVLADRLGIFSLARTNTSGDRRALLKEVTG